MTEVQHVFVPAIGDLHDVPVIEVLVSEGSSVTKDQGLLTLESDKATLEVPSPLSGVVKELKVRVGDVVSQGSLVALIAAHPSAEQPPTKETPSAHSPSTDSAHCPSVVPDLGDVDALPVIEVLVHVGQRVTQDQGLVVLESDKATIEVPSAVAGTVTEILVKEGDRLAAGQTVAMIDGETPSINGVVHSDELRSPRPSTAVPTAQSVPSPSVGSVVTELPYASPAVRLIARERGVDLAKIKGSGRYGRITREDVENVSATVGLNGGAKSHDSRAAASQPTVSAPVPARAWPQVDFAKFGPVRSQPLSRIKKLSGANLARNWALIPHVTQFDQADVTDLEDLRRQINTEQSNAGVKLTLLAFLMKASVAALKAYPEMNASLDESGEQLIIKEYFHIGFAADTANGLVVLVVRDVDTKGVIALSQEIASLAKKARAGTLSAADTTGGCFTISSLGGIGGTAFTPIINAPEIAILGVSRARMQPVWDGQAFVPRLLLPLALSYDHRAIDGVLAARFTTHLQQLIKDVRRLIL